MASRSHRAEAEIAEKSRATSGLYSGPSTRTGLAIHAGGTIREYIADMAAGMWFVAEQAAIDKTRVGIYGASLGGFEALWAAVNADPRALPATVVAAFPVRQR